MGKRKRKTPAWKVEEKKTKRDPEQVRKFSHKLA